MTNGLFLQKETVPKIEQDLIDERIVGPNWEISKLIVCYF